MFINTYILSKTDVFFFSVTKGGVPHMALPVFITPEFFKVKDDSFILFLVPKPSDV